MNGSDVITVPPFVSFPPKLPPPPPPKQFWHSCKTAARNAKRSISTILRENRGLWTVYLRVTFRISLKWRACSQARNVTTFINTRDGCIVIIMPQSIPSVSIPSTAFVNWLSTSELERTKLLKLSTVHICLWKIIQKSVMDGYLLSRETRPSTRFATACSRFSIQHGSSIVLFADDSKLFQLLTQ